MLRAGIQALLEASRPAWMKSANGAVNGLTFSMMVGAGAGLTQTGHPAFGALLLLDALQPVGVTQLRADPFALIPALGALAHSHPEAVVQVLDSYSLEQLGTAISVSGQPRPGRTAMKIKITTDDRQVIKQEVQGGHLWVYPLPLGKAVRVEVRAGGGLSIGGRGSLKMTLEGGTAGLIFDARGRPLPLAADARGRAAQLPLWVSEATGDPVKEIDEAWLAPLAEEAVEPVKAAKRRGRRGRQAEEATFEDEVALLEQLEAEGEALPDSRQRGTGRLRDLTELRKTDDDGDVDLDDLRG